jgi:hypothetical protein
MRIRHKIPSLFSLSMVDVLCCALGCVILLWLLGARQVEEDADTHRAEVEQLRRQADSEREKGQSLLTRSRQANDRLEERVRQLLAERDKAVALEARLAERIRGLEEMRDGLKSDLAGQQDRARDLEAKLKKSLARVAGLEEDVRSGSARLEKERRRTGSLDRRLSEAEAQLKGLRSDLEKARARHDTEAARAESLRKTIDGKTRDLAALNRSLAEARAAREKLETTLAARDKELAAARGYKDRWEAAEERERFLAKQLKDRHTAMQEANRTLASLQRQTVALKAAAENRFAGIELTGRRVIFLVDSSGSMELLDEYTDAPQKWVEVRNTVARLMRSLPGLEKYQLIVFNSKPDFLLGSAGKWLEHDPKHSPEQALKALAAVKPKGGTNMYAALEAAFAFRADGLDTIYLLSDGLPNQGEGLSLEQKRNLKELERGLILGKYVRGKLKNDWNRLRKGRKRVRINTIGFFYESPDLGSFLWALARENAGSFVGMSRP